MGILGLFHIEMGVIWNSCTAGSVMEWLASWDPEHICLHDHGGGMPISLLETRKTMVFHATTPSIEDAEMSQNHQSLEASQKHGSV